MNELSTETEETMTIQKVADILKKDNSTIRKIGKSLFPKKFNNGKITYLNEKEVTAIKLHLGKNSELAKTNLEKQLLIQQAMNLQQEMITELQTENENLTIENTVMKPKALEYDKFMCAENVQPIGEAAKVFGIGRNKLFKLLRDNKILMENNTPYQKYMEYFKVVEKPVKIGSNIINKPVTLINSKGLDYLSKKIIN